MHSRIIIQRTRNNLEHFKDGICERISKKRIEKNKFFFSFGQNEKKKKKQLRKKINNKKKEEREREVK